MIKFCGESYEEAFVRESEIKQNSSFSFHGSFWVQFKSDSSENRSGFRLWFQSKEPIPGPELSNILKQQVFFQIIHLYYIQM